MPRFFLLLLVAGVLPAIALDSSMVLIPGGTFSMGSTRGQKDERPVHRVSVDSFYLCATEVTIGDYLECVRSGACRMPFWWNKRFFPHRADDLPGNVWLNLPVTGVSWDDAQAYCRWKGESFRLPTEAEWEYAARGGRSSDYFWGSDPDSASAYAVIRRCLMPVGSRRPNPFGLHDMIGNAWEWCQDRYDPAYYGHSAHDNPCGPTDARKFPYRVVRGGAWNEYFWNLRVANRNYGEPFRRFDGVGFRICRSVRYHE